MKPQIGEEPKAKKVIKGKRAAPIFEVKKIEAKKVPPKFQEPEAVIKQAQDQPNGVAKRRGRKYQGNTRSTDIEVHLVTQRQIFRAFKRFFSKGLNEELQRDLRNIINSPEHWAQVSFYVDKCVTTVTKDYQKQKTEKKKPGSKNPNVEYYDLIGDPCYRFKKIAKEKFFDNEYLAFMFLIYYHYKGIDIVSKETDDVGIFYRQYCQLAFGTLNAAPDRPFK